ncbi:MAG TPA: hypothetical protein VFV42_10925 [Acidimicrobiales bacterium]|nr:hypothetical protein [Acidimicrobiales bacterium]
MAAADDRSTGDDVLAVVRAVLSRTRDAAGAGAGALGSGVDDAVRAVVDRRVQRALSSTLPGPTAVDVALALSSERRSSVAGRLGSTGSWVAGRRAARFVGSRHPVGLALRFGPGLYDAVTSALRGLDAAAAHLVARAREHGVEPDPDRLRNVVVQSLTGERVDPDSDPDHGALVRLWLAEAGRRMAPIGLGRISGLTRGRTPDAVAAALARVDVGQLRAR